MGDLIHVSQGQRILVGITDIEQSEFGGLILARQNLFPTEKRDETLTTYIRRCKAKLHKDTQRDEASIVSDDEDLNLFRETVVMMVGILILDRAQMMRIAVTETDYIRLRQEKMEDIKTNVRNLKVQSSPITVTSAEPSLYDPDSNWEFTDGGS